LRATRGPCPAAPESGRGFNDAPVPGPVMSIVVVHPYVQHAWELAKALEHGHLLLNFVTSVGVSPVILERLPRRMRDKLRSRSSDGIGKTRLTFLPALEIARWLSNLVLSPSARQRSLYLHMRAFDWLAARRLAAMRPRIVVGFENSCLHIFRRAKAGGALCVLDATSVHHSAQPPEITGISRAFSDSIKRRKVEEIRLADRIIVLSNYARDTYLAAGVSGEVISVIPPGIWLPRFDRDLPKRHPTDGIRFLFVGSLKLAKGVDLLLEAFVRLDAPGKHLLLAGTKTEAGALPRILPKGVEYHGQLPRDALYEAYSNADVLVLPSRADGFGFVVVEAMGCGLPVIVSSATGAKDLVEDQITGWIFETGSTEDLLRVMTAANSRRASLPAMGAQARQAVAKLSWDTYGVQTRTFYSHLLARTVRSGESEAPRP